MPEQEDLLNFSIAEEGAGDPATPSRPSCGSASATSASWVDEMNAELAEFDNLTSGLRQGVAGMALGSPSDPQWERRLEAELQAQLKTPPQQR